MMPHGGDKSSRATLRERITPWIGPLFAVAVMIAAFLLLKRQLKEHSWRDIMSKVAEVPKSRIALAIGITALNYIWLSGYDALAIRYLKRTLRPQLILLGSFVGYAMSHNFGWMMGGTTSRFRLYSAWGFSAVEIVKLFAMLGLTFTTGFCALAGIVFLPDPLPLPAGLRERMAELHMPLTSTFWLGPICLSVLAVYLILCAFGRSVAIRGWRIEPPPLSIAVMQMLVASGDFLLATGVMYVLLPAGAAISYWRFANVVLLALGASVMSHVPGGVGVLEAVVLE